MPAGVVECTTPRSNSACSSGSSRLRWADLDVEEEESLSQSSDLGVWQSASSGCSDPSLNRAVHENGSSVDSGSTGQPSQPGVGVAPRLRNDPPSLAAYLQGICIQDGLCSDSGSSTGRATRNALQRMAEHHALQTTGSIPATSSKAPVSSQAYPQVPPKETFGGSEQPPSVGSALHGVGSCKPCRLIFTPPGCQQGALCEFCHYRHSRKNTRPCKDKRDRFKRLAQRMEKSESSCEGREGSEPVRTAVDRGLLSL